MQLISIIQLFLSVALLVLFWRIIRSLKENGVIDVYDAAHPYKDEPEGHTRIVEWTPPETEEEKVWRESYNKFTKDEGETNKR